MRHDGLCNLVPDCKDRVQGGHGLLKDHGDPVPPNFPHLLGIECKEIAAFKQNLPCDHPCRRHEKKSHDGKGRYALAAPGLPHHTENLSFFQGQREMIHGLHHTGIGMKMDGQIFDFKDGHGMMDSIGTTRDRV